MTSDKRSTILRDVEDYYENKLSTFGETPKGVDWNNEASQILRFSQLKKLIENDVRYSVADLGCGYGAFFEFLKKYNSDFTFIGYDVSKLMVDSATNRYFRSNNAEFIESDKIVKKVDYSIASGIFNVKQNCEDHDWLAYIVDTLDNMNEQSEKGFAFNVLTTYSDLEKRKGYLYYADPLYFFDLCKTRYSKNVSLNHDYDLYEFTMIVRR